MRLEVLSGLLCRSVVVVVVTIRPPPHTPKTTRSRRRQPAARRRILDGALVLLFIIVIMLSSARRNGLVCRALVLHHQQPQAQRSRFDSSSCCSVGLRRRRRQSSSWQDRQLLLGDSASSYQPVGTNSGWNALNPNHRNRRHCRHRLCATVDDEVGEAPESAAGRDGGSTTVRQALRMTVQSLEEQDIPDPVPSAVQLLALALDLPWETGYRDLMQVWDSTTTNKEEETPLVRLTPTQAATLEQLLQRRRQHEPLQYICGQWDFLDYTLAVRAPLLCPRPETEELVELVVNDVLQQQQKQQQPQSSSDSNTPSSPTFRILDIGCGTGCIGIALADRLPGSVKVTAIDVEPVAIETSQTNAQRVLGADWQQRYEARLVSCEDFAVEPQPNSNNNNYYYDLVVSNPPYIPKADMQELDRTVKDYESPKALFGGGADGLDVIRTIVRRLPEWCAPSGGNAVSCWMEVDPTHPAKLRSWLQQQQQQQQDDTKDNVHLGRSVAFVRSEQDMFGRDRFVKLTVQE